MKDGASITYSSDCGVYDAWHKINAYSDNNNTYGFLSPTDTPILLRLFESLI